MAASLPNLRNAPTVHWRQFKNAMAMPEKLFVALQAVVIGEMMRADVPLVGGTLQ